MLSHSDNCIIFNSIMNNADSRDDADVELLKSLRSSNSEEAIREYYSRSTSIINRIKKSEFTIDWNSCYQQYVHAIVELLRMGNVDEAQARVFEMLKQLEITWGKE